MYSILRPLLFRLDAETSHKLTLYALRSTQYIPLALPLLQHAYATSTKPVQAFGLTFKNAVGLAAGYDKDGVAIRGLAALGFGHVEVGTVTPLPQVGNPRPRVFRLVEEEAVINRMGFPSQGMSQVVGRISKVGKRSVIVGVNLGKNKDTPLEEAARDYVTLMRTFMGLADYLTINISSPNTVGLRRLQGREMLEGLLKDVGEERRKSKVTCPVLVKISPDMTEEELDDAVGAILASGMDGIIATNTTLSREGLERHPEHVEGSRLRGESGGLSGSPLAAGSEAVLRRVVKLVDGKIPVVSVGGINNAAEAKKRLELGATLVQLYTGLIYHGPALVKQIAGV